MIRPATTSTTGAGTPDLAQHRHGEQGDRGDAKDDE